MSLIVDFFDYSFYRLSKLYQRWDGRAAATALVGVSMIQILYLTEPLMYIYFRLADFNTRQSYKDIGILISFILMFAVYSINQKRYKRIYTDLEERYSKENSKLKILKLAVMIIVFTLPLIFPFLVLPRK